MVSTERIPNPPGEDNTKHRSHVHIRPYRHPDDFDSVRRIYTQATLQGSGAPLTEGMARFASYLAYTGLALASGTLGLYIASVSWTREILESHRIDISLVWWGAVALTLASVLAGVYLCYCRRLFQKTIQEHVNGALSKDLGDIITGFKLHHSDEGHGFIISGPSGLWVAEDEGEVIGCGGLDHTRDNDPKTAEVRRLAVSPYHQRRGVGDMLMETVISHARAHGLESLSLTTSDLSTAAVTMYEKRGWVLQKKLRVRMGIPVNVVFFQKKLDIIKE